MVVYSTVTEFFCGKTKKIKIKMAAIMIKKKKKKVRVRAARYYTTLLNFSRGLQKYEWKYRSNNEKCV